MPDGKLYNRTDYDLFSIARAMNKVLKEVQKQKLVPTHYVMNKADWDDIVKFSQGD